MKRNIFVKNAIYHICNKSISHLIIFRNTYFIERFLSTIEYYNSQDNKISYSHLIKYGRLFIPNGLLHRNKDQIIRIIAYCVMPDHYHILIKPLISEGKSIYRYIGKVENSFSRFFNLKTNRQGPLWQSRYRSVLIKTNEQLLHVSRYIHLNPVTKELVEKSENWIHSSYVKYLDQSILNDLKEISITNSKTYRQFVEDNIDYQKTLRNIKSRLLE